MIFLTATFLLIHEFYAKECCEGQHCRPVPCSEIIAGEHEWRWGNIKFYESQLKISPDGKCHVCTNGQVPFCIYLPPRA